MKFGAHVSGSGSLDLAFDRAKDLGADCFQTFLSPPQQWVKPSLKPEVVEKFKQKAIETGIGPNFIHGTYLISLGTSNPEHLQKSIDWLVYALDAASQLGVQGVIFHLGSHKGAGFAAIKEQVIQALSEVLQNAKGEVQLILETSAGAGGNIGGQFNQLGELLKAVNDPRAKICLDIQHVFAAGYEIHTKIGLEMAIEEFDREIGLENLVVVHVNDSKTEFSSGKDRHDNIGAGAIGSDGFGQLLQHPVFKNLPLILEVPGFENTGPDVKNLSILRSLVKEV